MFAREHLKHSAAGRPQNHAAPFRRKIVRWIARLKDRLVACLHRFHEIGNGGMKSQLPGSNGTLQDKAKTIPGRALECLEANIEKVPIDNKLKSAQTETEYLKQELIRQLIAKTVAETEGQKLANLSTEIEIQSRIKEITSVRNSVRENDGNGTVRLLDDQIRPLPLLAPDNRLNLDSP